MKELLLILSVCLCFAPGLLFADNDLTIGGDNSFNQNQGSITINATNQVDNEQGATAEKIEKRIAEVSGDLMNKKNITAQQRKLLSGELSILGEARKINEQKIPRESKLNICKTKADVHANIFGHDVNFLYKKCEDLF